MALDAEILLAHSAWLARLARALVVRDDEIDDVVQQTFAQALAQPPRHTKNIRAWLGTIAKNVVRSTRRSDTARVAREIAIEPSPPIEDPAEAVERAELRQLVVKTVLDLDEPYRSTLILRFFEEMDVAAIARMTESGQDTVRTRIRRGVIHVREQLERHVRDQSRDSADGGAAALAAMFTQLRRIAATGGNGGGAVGPTGTLRAAARAGGKRAAVATVRRVLIGVATVAVVAGGWWWRANPRRSTPSTTETASRPKAGSEPLVPVTPTPAVAVERSPVPVVEPPKKPVSRLAARFALRGTLHGVVRDPEGHPVPGAHVWAILTASHAPEWSMPEFATQADDEAELEAKGQKTSDWVGTISSGDGRFEISGLSTIPGWAIGALEPTVGAMVTPPFSFSHDHTDIAADVQLSRGGFLHGLIQDEEGVPIGASVVFLYTTVGKEVSRFKMVTWPDGKEVGEYNAGFRCGDSLELECRAPGYLPSPRKKVEFTPGSRKTRIDITLKRRPGIVARGRIVDPTGLPIKMRDLLASIFTTTPAWARPLTSSVRAISSIGASSPTPPGQPPPGSSEGRFDFDADMYEIIVDDDFRGVLELKIAKVVVGTVPFNDPSHPPDLPCDAAKIPKESTSLRFSARFVDAETKEPINLSNDASLPGATDGKKDLLLFRDGSDAEHGLICYGCEPGFLKIEAEIPGYALTPFIFDVSRETQREPVTLEVPPAQAGLRGTVCHEDGRPFPNTPICVYRVTPSGLVDSGRLVVSNPDGDFEFNSLARGEHVLVVSGRPTEAPAAVRVFAADPFPEIDVRTMIGFATRFRVGTSTPKTANQRITELRILDRDGVALESVSVDRNQRADSNDEIRLHLCGGHYAAIVERTDGPETRLEFDVPARDVVEIQPTSEESPRSK